MGSPAVIEMEPLQNGSRAGYWDKVFVALSDADGEIATDGVGARIDRSINIKKLKSYIRTVSSYKVWTGQWTGLHC